MSSIESGSPRCRGTIDLADSSLNVLGLDELDDDLLMLIIEALGKVRPYRSLQDIFSFSAVCRRLRVLCKPVIFRRCRFTHNPLGFFTQQDQDVYDAGFRIGTFIKFLSIAIDRPLSNVTFRFLQALLPRLTRLQTLNLRRLEEGLSLSFAQILFSPPNLQEVILQMVDWIHDQSDTPIFPLLPPLKKYVERRTGDNDFRGTLPLVHFPYHIEHISASPCDMLRQLDNSLEVLQLPLHPYHLHVLPSLTWSSLRCLALYGFYPSNGPPLLPLLNAMPNLLSLKVLSWSYVEKSPSQMSENMRLPPLQELVIGYISPTDPLFSMLPETLTSLSIRDAPRYYLYPRDESPASPPSADQFCLLFRSRSFHHLRNLEIAFSVVTDDFTMEQSLYKAMIHVAPVSHAEPQRIPRCNTVCSHTTQGPAQAST
ncbi:hypothetical protein K474DRAFT_1709818 [Panus rudis PR-1116 ss-1]|nr:hypothetical protein K474DRAFT_1709818 [Panus rudis PR-1116 ss-1]